jgi:hypothetical protein
MGGTCTVALAGKVALHGHDAPTRPEECKFQTPATAILVTYTKE